MSNNAEIKLSAMLLLLACGQILLADVKQDIRSLAGAPAKIAWLQETGTNKYKMLGFDTEDNSGERVIEDEVQYYCLPLITYDGSRIVYTDRGNKKVYVINWNGSGKKLITSGIALDYWADASTGKEWIYVVPDYAKTVKPVKRFQIDKPSVSELIWDKTSVSYCFFIISGDGKRAGGCFPWSDCGLGVLPNKSWKKFGTGCFASISPDEKYNVWIFDGLHRNVTMYNKDGKNLGKVDIHSAPGIKGWEIYWPRWSNKTRFMTMVGPYTGGSSGSCDNHNCGNKIGAGGDDIEVYLGKFNAGLSEIEKWVKVTNNSKEDIAPDAWIANATSVNRRAGTGFCRLAPALLSSRKYPPAARAYTLRGQLIHSAVNVQNGLVLLQYSNSLDYYKMGQLK